MNPGGAGRPSRDWQDPARGASCGCRLSFTLGALVASLLCAPAAASREEAFGLIRSTSGALAALWPPSRVSPRAPAASRFPGAPEGKEACPEQAGGTGIKVLAARRAGLHFPPCAGTRSAAGSTGRGEGAALGLPNAWTICRRCSCNMLELQNI